MDTWWTRIFNYSYVRAQRCFLPGVFPLDTFVPRTRGYYGPLDALCVVSAYRRDLQLSFVYTCNELIATHSMVFGSDVYVYTSAKDNFTAAAGLLRPRRVLVLGHLVRVVVARRAVVGTRAWHLPRDQMRVGLESTLCCGWISWQLVC